ncbi:MAG: damage-inducible protein DinB [Acidobacteria bacterium]|nr:damage-inducible protein DinB [Acidobacteriota bacterium]
MRYGFLVETYETERLKVLGVWSMFRDEDLPVRPRATDRRGRSVHEQMVHQCVGEDLWFRTMLGIATREPALPEIEKRLDFIERYAASSAERQDALRSQPEPWWEGETRFFDTARSRAWVVVRRIAHTSHHRGQQMAMLRMLGRDLHSNYGPTADTGGLMRDHAPVIYAYSSIEELLAGERAGGRKAPLPGPGERPPTERPGN